jgi:hypothetical protein
MTSELQLFPEDRVLVSRLALSPPPKVMKSLRKDLDPCKWRWSTPRMLRIEQIQDIETLRGRYD